MFEYKGKTLKALDKVGIDESNISEDKKKQFQPLLDFLKEKIADIGDARLTNRLKESAVCLVSDEGTWSANMQKLMSRMGQGAGPAGPRVLEVNPSHPVIEALEAVRAKDAGDVRLDTLCHLSLRRGADLPR